MTEANKYFRFGLSTLAICLLASCEQKTADPGPTPSDAAIASSVGGVAPVLAETHNYIEEDAGTYFYVTAVSEEDQKRGVAAGDVIGYRYLGKNDEGQDTLALVAKDGRVVQRSYCSEPCAIIKVQDGERIAYNTQSIIGSAFEDAINGKLKAAPERDPASYPRFVSSIPRAFQGSWDELTQDKCEGREARFMLEATKFHNFEVAWDVTKVKLISATELDLYTTTKDEDANQVDEVWQFRLADGGKSLTSRKPGGTFFRRCPIA